MNQLKTSPRMHWASRVGFILAAAGSAIGLGNIWKFPYMAGMNGGGAFVLVYLVCIFAVGLPIFVSELYIGLAGQKNAVQSFETTHRRGSPWRIVGWMGVISAAVILSFYSVVGGWVLDFLFNSLTNQFTGQSDAEITSAMGILFSDGWRQLFWHAMFMAATVAIVLGGVKDGIEKWSKILMPALFLLLAFLLIRSFFLEGFGRAMAFLFAPDFSKLNGRMVLEAVGQAFFTLSLGLGVMITYGSYLSGEKGLAKTAITVALMDTLVAVGAGIIIFAAVFTYGLEPGSGPTLIFQTLPLLFSKMTGSYYISIAFFTLVAFAAVTSSVSLLEVVVAYFVEARRKDRFQTTLWAGAAIYALGILSALSTNVLGDLKFSGMTFFDLFDKLTSSVLLPLGGMLIALFVGWVLGPKSMEGILKNAKKNKFAATALLWTIRVIAPAAVLGMLINGLKEW